MRSVPETTIGIFLLALGISLPNSVRSQAPFTEEAAARGVTGTVYYGQWTLPWGAGVALDDLDGDGDADCVLTVVGASGAIRILENVGGGAFADRSSLSLLPIGLEYCGVSLADYDGDADLDLYLSAWYVPNVLLLNDGAFSFTDVTATAGVGDTGFGTGSCWADYDGDGHLDLYLCNRTASVEDPLDTTPNRLYRNLGDGTFQELGASFGLDDPWKTFQAQFFDHDLDGDQDLYLSTDKGNGLLTNHNRLFENQGGSFVEISVASGTAVAIDSMGLDTADFDSDGDFDIYVTNVASGNKYFRNDGDGTYTQLAASLGIASYLSGWACLFWDFDNDSWTDLYVANSVGPNRLYIHGGVFPAVDVAAYYQIHDAGYLPTPTGSAYCAATADIDLDGDLDMLVQTWNEPLALYINHEGTARNHLRVIPRQPGPNRFAVGATVQIRAGALVRREQIRAGRGYKSSSELVAHFGLGTLSAVDEVLVRWPDGALTRVLGVAANQTITIDRQTAGELFDCDRDFVPDADQLAAGVPPDTDGDGDADLCAPYFRRGDAGMDGVLDIADAIAILAQLFGRAPQACPDASDGNDDGAIDIADPIVVLSHLFANGPALPAPWPLCGSDPSPDTLGCAETTLCP